MDVLLMHYNAVLVYLTETAFFLPIASRTATLHACLLATHAFLNSLLSLPIQEYAALSYVTWVQAFYVLSVVSNLSKLDNEDWDSSHVQGVLDLGLVLGAMIVRFENIEAAHENQITILKVTVPRLQKFKEDFEAKRIEIMQRKMMPYEVAYSAVPDLPVVSAPDSQWGHLDDAFWQEIMADWDTPSFMS